jgi:hypothetical protein
VTGETMAASDIYTMACSQVVGITTEVTYTNAFGMTSSAPSQAAALSSRARGTSSRTTTSLTTPRRVTIRSPSSCITAAPMRQRSWVMRATTTTSPS